MRQTWRNSSKKDKIFIDLSSSGEHHDENSLLTRFTLNAHYFFQFNFFR
jgi:hypothetical protein